MNSGNTHRMRPDGSRVEQFTWGQVNPFGLQFDPSGDLFSVDCHSSPVRDRDNSENPWALEERISADGQKSLFLSSWPVNEAITGVIRSRPFIIPATFNFFWLAMTANRISHQ